MPQLNGALIRRKRQELGTKVGPFAVAVDTSRSHLINIENGARPASIELAHRIALALKVEVETLLQPQGEARE